VLAARLLGATDLRSRLARCSLALRRTGFAEFPSHGGRPLATGSDENAPPFASRARHSLAANGCLTLASHPATTLPRDAAPW
jgi:hypothetical protein